MKAVALASTTASPKFLGWMISSSVASSSGDRSTLVFPDFGWNCRASIIGCNFTKHGILLKSAYPLLLTHLTFYLFSNNALITKSVI